MNESSLLQELSDAGVFPPVILAARRLSNGELG